MEGPGGDDVSVPTSEETVPVLRARLEREDPVTQFARFAAVGGSSSLVYAVLFVSLLH